MTEVIMPKMGDGMEEGTLVEWLIKEGDPVKSGEVIGTIQTDKATLELEAPGTGRFAGVLIKPGDTVPVGQPIAALLREGEELPTGWGGAGTTVETPKPDAGVANEPAPSNGSPAAAVAPPGQQTSGRVIASPLARRLAQESGVDLASLKGSGPGGRIVEKDVRSATSTVSQPEAPAQRPASTAPVAQAEDRTVKLNPIRMVTAKRTRQAMDEAPHFYVTVEVDVDRLMRLRDMMKEEEAGGVSVNDFVLVACAKALREMPNVNASFAGDHVIEHGAVNIGIAVALEDGLTVPVLHHADQLTVRAVAEKARDLAKRARENRLHLDELQGSTFSVSNMGMLDVDDFGAIINVPNAAIVAVSTARRKPVVTADDDLEVRWLMNMTGSFDHRVVDGAIGAKFMNVVRGYLQNPTRLLT